MKGYVLYTCLNYVTEGNGHLPNRLPEGLAAEVAFLLS